MMTAMVKAEPTGAAAGAEGSSGRRDAEAELNLPPGFRFHPTDDELVVHYLCRKVAGQPQPVPIIAEVDLYKFNPWDLPGAPSLPPLSPPLPCFFLSSFLLLGFLVLAPSVCAVLTLAFVQRGRCSGAGSGTSSRRATASTPTARAPTAPPAPATGRPRAPTSRWRPGRAAAGRSASRKRSSSTPAGRPGASRPTGSCTSTASPKPTAHPARRDPSSWTNGCCAGCTTRRTTGRSSRWSRTWLWRPGRTGRSWTRWRPTPCPTASRRTTPPRSTAPPACSSMVSWTWRSSRRGW
ncbi:hypothetical protein CFC21_036692 [Triticum aestivum]|uniref:NAC domain-containing protein n=2 Tax=Triticum aestivum TaxID=4565 RepID=A0A9R1F9M7_WHEAT|nr:hypothetical protein CFC21_036692 [Triticum aestivum]